jgi:hypothetical protein
MCGDPRNYYATSTQLQISTLDSFFVQLARGLAPELGLPIDWQIVEEFDDQRLRTEAMQALLADGALAELVNSAAPAEQRRGSSIRSCSPDDIATELYILAQQTDTQAWHSPPTYAAAEPRSPWQRPSNR